MRTCGPWGMRPRNLSSSRRPRVLFYLKATTPLCIRVVWARRGVSPAGCSTMARTKRTAQAPGRPSPLLDPSRSCGEPVTRLRRTTRWGAHVSSAQHKRLHRGRPLARGTGAVADGDRESEGCIGAMTSGNGGHARTRPSKGGPCWCELRKGTMPNALTLDDRSPRLRKVVGRESPRVTSTEEPDGGNLLVRIWRGAGVGNLPAYSTTVFLPRCRRECPPGAPAAWTPQRLGVPLPAPARRLAGCGGQPAPWRMRRLALGLPFLACLILAEVFSLLLYICAV